MKLVFLLLLLLCAPFPEARAREAAVAGQFYPADKAELAAFVDAALAAPGVKKPQGAIAALLVPHAGYVYSGKLAGLAYSLIDDNYDTVVILSAAHTENIEGAAILASDFYQTPLGRVLPDKELAAALLKSCPLFKDKPSAHAREHAVEVQLPFLQRKLKKPFKLLAAVISTNDRNAQKTMAAALAELLANKKALFVISTDLSHYPDRATAAVADGAMRLAIESLDPDLVMSAAGFMLRKNIPGLETCACGEAALETGMELARLLGARSFHTLKLSNSYAENPSPGPDKVVGYLSGLFLKSGKPFDLRLSKEQKAALLKEARLTLERQFKDGRQPAGLAPDPRLNLPGAVFVTLTKGGQLRGCVGTVSPSLTLADAVRYGALGAAFSDNRFPRLKQEELAGIRIEVSVLSFLTPARAGEIRPGMHGVLLSKDARGGLFLPQVWAQIPAKEDFLGELCSQKAGLPRDCWKDPKTSFYTFTVDSLEEDEKIPPANAASAAPAAK